MGANSDEYVCIFTSGTTASLRELADSFVYGRDGELMYAWIARDDCATDNNAVYAAI